MLSILRECYRHSEMVAAHIAEKSLHTAIIAIIAIVAIVAMISALYISFSIWMAYVFSTNETIIWGFMDDLNEIGDLKSQGAAAILAAHEFATNTSKIPGLTFTFALGGTFLSTNIFLWYSHFRR